MRHILSSPGLRLLEQFAHSQVLLAFDYDGTLAPITGNPGEAHMRAETKAALRQLVQRYPCAVISGRARSDVLRFVGNLPLREVSGSHGLEPSHAFDTYSRLVRSWLVLFGREVGGLQGVTIEDKRYSVAVHYRKSRDKKRVLAAIQRIGESLPRARLIRGKQVVNFVPDGAPHKGMALRRIREEQICDTAIYVGDDETDEDVFHLDEPGQLLTIRVGASPTSRAMFCLRSQVEIDQLMRCLVKIRPATRAPRSGALALQR